MAEDILAKNWQDLKRLNHPLKAEKNKRRTTVESDWQDYYGSSDELTADIEKIGKEKFKREILYYCYSKGECNYIEAREQFRHRVLESDEWYNGHIRVRVHQRQKILTESNK